MGKNYNLLTKTSRVKIMVSSLFEAVRLCSEKS